MRKTISYSKEATVSLLSLRNAGVPPERRSHRPGRRRPSSFPRQRRLGECRRGIQCRCAIEVQTGLIELAASSSPPATAQSSSSVASMTHCAALTCASVRSSSAPARRARRDLSIQWRSAALGRARRGSLPSFVRRRPEGLQPYHGHAKGDSLFNAKGDVIQPGGVQTRVSPAAITAAF
jgi:hypothetical protein